MERIKTPAKQEGETPGEGANIGGENIMSEKKASVLMCSGSIQEKANHYMSIATSAKVLISHDILILPNSQNSEPSVRNNLPGRVLWIHLETPDKVHSLPPILYTAKNAKM